MIEQYCFASSFKVSFESPNQVPTRRLAVSETDMYEYISLSAKRLVDKQNNFTAVRTIRV